MLLGSLRQRLLFSRQSPAVRPLRQSRNTHFSTNPRPFFTPTTRIMEQSLYRTPGLRRAYHYSSYGPYGSDGGVMSAYWALFGANALVFGAIKYAEFNNDRRLQSKLLKNTLMSVDSWDSGRWWTAITSAFAHVEIWHFGFNMVALNTMCNICAHVPGVRGSHIIGVALGSAITGAGGFLWHQRDKMRKAGRGNQATFRAYHQSALGASGVVMGVSAVATCLLPRHPIQLMLIPIAFPLWVATFGYAVVDTYFLDSSTTHIAHAGHLGGLVFGTIYYFAFLRKAPVGVWRGISKFLSTRR